MISPKMSAADIRRDRAGRGSRTQRRSTLQRCRGRRGRTSVTHLQAVENGAELGADIAGPLVEVVMGVENAVRLGEQVMDGEDPGGRDRARKIVEPVGERDQHGAVGPQPGTVERRRDRPGAGRRAPGRCRAPCSRASGARARTSARRCASRSATRGSRSRARSTRRRPRAAAAARPTGVCASTTPSSASEIGATSSESARSPASAPKPRKIAAPVVHRKIGVSGVRGVAAGRTLEFAKCARSIRANVERPPSKTSESCRNRS